MTVNKYAWIYVRRSIYIYMFVCTYENGCMTTNTYVCMYVYIYVYTYYNGCVVVNKYVGIYECKYVCVCMYVFIFIDFLLFIYLHHVRLHGIILHACRKLYDIYAVFTFLRICLHTVYVRIVRLQFFHSQWSLKNW